MIDPRPSRRAVLRVLTGAATAAVAAACSTSPSPTTFDLTAPRQRVGGGAIAGQVLVVAEPVAIQVLEAERIIVKDASGAVSFLGGAQWADRLPRLVQARLIQTFENASRIRAVSRPGDRIVADYQLNSEIRAFQIDAATSQAVVELSARLINDRSGRVALSRIFTGRVPVPTIDAGNAAQALDRALSIVLLEIVRWVSAGHPAG
jgi:cholesterol transport system auxiliary component